MVGLALTKKRRYAQGEPSQQETIMKHVSEDKEGLVLKQFVRKTFVDPA